MHRCEKISSKYLHTFCWQWSGSPSCRNQIFVRHTVKAVLICSINSVASIAFQLEKSLMKEGSTICSSQMSAYTFTFCCLLNVIFDHPVGILSGPVLAVMLTRFLNLNILIFVDLIIFSQHSQYVLLRLIHGVECKDVTFSFIGYYVWNPHLHHDSTLTDEKIGTNLLLVLLIHLAFVFVCSSFDAPGLGTSVTWFLSLNRFDSSWQTIGLLVLDLDKFH